MFSLIVLICLGVATSSAQVILPSIYNSDFIETDPNLDFRCTRAGNFPHPTRCTMYVFCGSNLAPAEKECPSCIPHPVRCPNARLHFDSESRNCLWADEAKCGWPKPTTTTAPSTTTTRQTTTTTTPTTTTTTPTTTTTTPTTTTTTPTTTTTTPTTTTTTPTTTTTTSTTTTTTPTTTTTTPTTTTTTPTTTTTTPPPTTPVPGDECKLNCTQVGDCACYDTCVEDPTSSTGGRWFKQYFDYNATYWNPDVGPHGGVCDFWENLSPEVKEKYRNDKDCPTDPIPCEWKQDLECANKYYYQPEGQKNGRFEIHLYCPKSLSGQSLFWDHATKTCRSICTSHPTCIVC